MMTAYMIETQALTVASNEPPPRYVCPAHTIPGEGACLPANRGEHRVKPGRRQLATHVRRRPLQFITLTLAFWLLNE